MVPGRVREQPFAPLAFLAVHEAFAPGGALAATFPGFEARPEQAALADAVDTALATGEHLLAEAGTGTGKSLAYLLPALESAAASSSPPRPRPCRSSCSRARCPRPRERSGARSMSWC